MPSWGGILAEINALLQKNNPTALDLVRRKYLASQYTHSKRAVILYATKWTEPVPGLPPDMLSIAEGDIQGLMECAHGIKETKLDLIIHSPGGSPAAAEACVEYLRARFEHIRVFVPHAAMSAATMMACAADEIVLGEHSFLGPIDPQLIMQTPLGPRAVPAQAILDQFEKAKKECADPAKLPVWLPMLQQYGPDLLIECENVLALSQEIVGKWLSTYMFKGEDGASEKAKQIAAWLADHGNFKLHGRYIGRTELEKRGLKITKLEDDKLQQDFILSIFHATTHTFSNSGAVKIMENHAGAAFVRQVQQIALQAPPQQVRPPSAPQRPEQPPFPRKR